MMQIRTAWVPLTVFIVAQKIHLIQNIHILILTRNNYSIIFIIILWVFKVFWISCFLFIYLLNFSLFHLKTMWIKLKIWLNLWSTFKFCYKLFFCGIWRKAVFILVLVIFKLLIILFMVNLARLNVLIYFFNFKDRIDSIYFLWRSHLIITHCELFLLRHTLIIFDRSFYYIIHFIF